MFCEIKSIAFKIKILTCLLLCRSFGNIRDGSEQEIGKFSWKLAI